MADSITFENDFDSIILKNIFDSITFKDDFSTIIFDVLQDIAGIFDLSFDSTFE